MKASPQSHDTSGSYYKALGQLVGEHVRQATEADAVAGVQPQLVVSPGSEEEVAAVLSLADREGLKVLVRGGGTQLNTGLPPAGGDMLLSMERLNSVIEHAPHDMTVSVQAGLRLVDLQAHLGQARQWLALDPVLSPGATIGGIISTNVSGARRLRYGGVRDQIIGIRVVLPDGTIAKGGGKVVKNVAGYDLPKLFAGALGTLGVIVAATFRLYPLRAAARTVLLTAASPAPLAELAVRIIASTLEPTIIDIMSPDTGLGEYTLAVRFEMEPEAADEQAATLMSMAVGTGGGAGVSGGLVPVLGNARMLRGEEEAQFWQKVAGDFPLGIDADQVGAGNTSTSLVVKASVLPTDVASWLESLAQTTKEAKLSTRLRAHAGHGLIFARLAGAETALANAVEHLRRLASAVQGSLVVLDAPPALASKVDVWGPIPALELMRRLKVRFDPNVTLNPGRFVGGI